MFKAFRESIYSKTLLLFAAVMLVVMLVSVAANMQSQRLSREQYIDSSLAKARFFLDMFEYEVRVAQGRLLDLLSDKTLSELAALPRIDYTPNHIRLILGVKESLMEIASQSDYIQEVTVFLPRQERQIDTHFSYEPMDNSKYIALLNAIQEGKSPFLEDCEEWYTGYAKYYQRSQAEGYDFIVAIQWHRAKISRTLGELYTPPNSDPEAVGGALLLGGYGGITATHITNPEGIHSHFLGYAYGGTQSTQGSAQIRCQGTPLIVVWKQSPVLRSTLLVFEGESKLNYLLAFLRWSFVALILVASVAAVLFVVTTRKLIAQPLLELKAAFQQFERDNFPGEMEITQGDDFHLLFGYFQAMVRRTDQLIQQIYRQRILVQNAQLKQLQSQINPHFLYNSLLCARNLIKFSHEQAAIDLLRHLASYYEYITRDAKDCVTLKAEMQHVLNYTQIQAVRFGGRLSIHVDPVPAECADLTVPRLILQPLAENCFEHGLKNKAAGAMLAIRFEIGEGLLVVLVEDNGQIEPGHLLEMQKMVDIYDPQVEISGLVNVHRRLAMKFGGQSGLTFSQSDMGGLKVALTIQIERE